MDPSTDDLLSPATTSASVSELRTSWTSLLTDKLREVDLIFFFRFFGTAFGSDDFRFMFGDAASSSLIFLGRPRPFPGDFRDVLFGDLTCNKVGQWQLGTW